MNEELKNLLKKHIEERVLDFSEHPISKEDIDEVFEEIKINTNKTIDKHIDKLNIV